MSATVPSGRTLTNEKDRREAVSSKFETRLELLYRPTAAAVLYPFSRFGDKKLAHSAYPPNRIRKRPTTSTEDRTACLRLL